MKPSVLGVYLDFYYQMEHVFKTHVRHLAKLVPAPPIFVSPVEKGLPRLVNASLLARLELSAPTILPPTILSPAILPPAILAFLVIPIAKAVRDPLSTNVHHVPPHFLFPVMVGAYRRVVTQHSISIRPL